MLVLYRNVKFFEQHYAARSGHRDVCCLLLNHGAEVNAATTAGSATPLHRAAYMGHANIVQLLLSHGANPHLTDSDGMTALHKVQSFDSIKHIWQHTFARN